KTNEPNKNFKSGYKEIEKEVHKVQFLDPATGTGTFLAEIIKHIHKGFSAMQGAWPSYVENDLIPRLNGFELLMASYAMAHLKLDLLLTETGYKPTINQRFKVYLTNSLEEAHQDTGTLFLKMLSMESSEANLVKRDTPVMCVIGNPPYSGISSNNGKWISNLIEDYKYVDGIHFNERKHWLNDDYVKFLRYGQHYIEKNGSGVLAFINPHGFLDNPTFRGMRWNLLKTYDKIYTIDLHGNSKKKETAPDGSADINVFDIQQGVSINVFVKTGKKKANELGKILHYDLYGKRDFKYDFLNENSIQSIEFNELPNVAPNYFFVPKDFEAQESYEKGFKVNEFFTQNSVGFVSANDGMNISMTEKEQREKIQDILTLEEAVWRLKYNRAKDAQSWKYKWAKEDAEKNQSDTLSKVSYRPFDTRYTLYTGVSGGLYARPTFDTMQNFINGKNVGLNWIRPMSAKYEFSIFISQYITDQCSAGNKSAGAGISYLGPLYLYSKTSGQQTIEQSEERTPNLNQEIVKEIAEKLSLNFTNEKESNKNTFAPIDILDYIYAVLHSPSYREKYKEFLKIDFPRVPYPKNQDTFWKLVKLGGEIRQIHLLESATVEQYITQFQIGGSDLVSRKMSKNSPGYVPNNETHGKVYINDEQYFDNVPLVAWEFYIGGYQPAQKWLKDRNGRKLEWEDIAHYQKIIVALSETDRIMKEIDEIKI
ncbi:MAG: type ISP restriction/modification enzyme, partial [Bacteroidia bacterium]